MDLSKFKARLLLVTCAALYGSNFVGTKYLQRSISPYIAMFLRFLIGSVFFLPYVHGYNGDRGLYYAGIEVGAYCALGFLVQAATLQYTSASKNSFITALSVVLIPLFDILIECKQKKQLNMIHLGGLDAKCEGKCILIYFCSITMIYMLLIHR